VIGAGADISRSRVALDHGCAQRLPSRSDRVTPKTHLYAEVHESAGDIGMHAFHYSLAAGRGPRHAHTSPVRAGSRSAASISIRVTATCQSLACRFKPRQQLLASASYAYSLGGNLGTKLATLRFDYSGKVSSAIVGAAGGYAAPSVLNLLGRWCGPVPR